MEAGVAATLSGWWDDPTVSLRTSGTGDKVREGALGGDTGRGEPAEGEPTRGEGLPLTMGEMGEELPLLACPLMLSLWMWAAGRGWLFAVMEVVAAAPSTGLQSWGGASCLMVTRRLWAVLKCSIRSQVIGRLGQYGQTT